MCHGLLPLLAVLQTSCACFFAPIVLTAHSLSSTHCFPRPWHCSLRFLCIILDSFRRSLSPPSRLPAYLVCYLVDFAYPDQHLNDHSSILCLEFHLLFNFLNSVMNYSLAGRLHLKNSPPELATQRTLLLSVQTFNILFLCSLLTSQCCVNFFLWKTDFSRIQFKSFKNLPDCTIAAVNFIPCEQVFKTNIFQSSVTCQCCQQLLWLWPFTMLMVLFKLSSINK